MTLKAFPLANPPGDGTGGGSVSAGSGTGSSSGGAPARGAGSGTSSNQGASSSGQGFSSGTGGSAPIRLTDDAVIDLGDGKPIAFKDYRSQYVPKTQADDLLARYNKGKDYLLEQARKLEQSWQALQSQGQHRGQQRPDPLSKFRNMGVVSGQALAEAYEAMRQGDLAPMQQVVQQQQKAIQQLGKQLQQLHSSVGSISEERSEREYYQQLDGAISSLGIDGLDFSQPELKPHAALVRELADDVFRSHDPRDQNYAREMPAVFKQRLEGLLKLAVDLNKVRVRQAKDQKRMFWRPGGQVSPTGQPQYVHENGRQLARRFFGSTEGNAT